jgi:GAF domain-containing protein
VRVDDVAADDRWPEFSRAAVEPGVGSMICFQLLVEGGRLGAMNLCARRAGAFGGESEEIGLLFASHAAVALAGAEYEEHLRRGITNRNLIGQAKGILMERHELIADQAFDVLVRFSSESHRKLADIADELSPTGAMPLPRGSRD